MKLLYYRIGMDTGVGGCVGPIFKDGTFEYIPIPDYFTTEQRTYSNIKGRSGRAIRDFVPEKIANCPIHWDPEFSATNPVCCEGTTQQNIFTKLEPDDFLVHYAGLSSTPLNPGGNIDLYFIGFMKVKEVIKIKLLNVEKVPINAHTRRYLFVKNLILDSLSTVYGQTTWEKIKNIADKIENLSSINRSRFYTEQCEKILLKSPIFNHKLQSVFVNGKSKMKLKQSPSCLSSRIKEITPPLHVFIEFLQNSNQAEKIKVAFPANSYSNICAYLLWCFSQFILVVGTSESQLLTKAVQISKRSVDRRGNFLNRVKDDIAPLLGLPKETSLQRKNLRFVPNPKYLKGDPNKVLDILEDNSF